MSATTISAPAGRRVSPFPSSAGADPCPERFHDCRCVGWAGHAPRPGEVVAFHLCAVPGCGGVWSAGVVVRLPARLSLRRRFDRADLRSVSA